MYIEYLSDSSYDDYTDSESIDENIEYEICYDCHYKTNEEKENFNIIDNIIKKYHGELIKNLIDRIKPSIY